MVREAVEYFAHCVFWPSECVVVPWGISLSCQFSSPLVYGAQFHRCFDSISFYFPVKERNPNNHHPNTVPWRWGEKMLDATILIAAYCLGITEVSFKQDSVTAKELLKRVADRITRLAYPDSLHHSRITELAMAQIPVKQLKHRWKESDLLTSHKSLLKCVKFQCDTGADTVSLCLSKWSFCPHHGLLEFIGFNAAYEKGLARSQCLHHWIQRIAELAYQSWHALLSIHILLSDLIHKIEILWALTCNDRFSCVKEATDPNTGSFGDDPRVENTRGGEWGQSIMKCLFEKFTARFLHQLYQIWTKRVTVFLKKA